MRHDQIDAAAVRLNASVNARLAEESKSWSRFAWDQEIDRVCREELGDNWAWVVSGSINGAPKIALTQYLGDIQR